MRRSCSKKSGNPLWETLEETRTHAKMSRNDVYCARSRTTREDKRKEAREQEKGRKKIMNRDPEVPSLNRKL